MQLIIQPCATSLLLLNSAPGGRQHHLRRSWFCRVSSMCSCDRGAVLCRPGQHLTSQWGSAFVKVRGGFPRAIGLPLTAPHFHHCRYWTSAMVPLHSVADADRYCGVACQKAHQGGNLRAVWIRQSDVAASSRVVRSPSTRRAYGPCQQPHTN